MTMSQTVCAKHHLQIDLIDWFSYFSLNGLDLCFPHGPLLQDIQEG